MPKIKCYDIVREILDEAAIQFGPQYVEVKEYSDILRQYCEKIDIIADEFDAVSYDVDVDEFEKTISITIETVDLSLDNPNHLFYKIASKSLSVRFSYGDDGYLATTFVFPSVWEAA